MERVAPFAVGLLQVVLVALLLADPAALTAVPIRSLDYAAHFYNARRAAEHVWQSGRLWGYDPFWMAGFPQGLVSLIDGKLFCLLMLFAPRGIEALVFNGAVLGMLVCVPWLVYAAAATAGLAAAERVWAALVSMIVVFTVPAAVLFWSWGGISFFFGSALAVPVALLLAASLCEGSLTSRRGTAGALGALLVSFIHPVCGLLVAASVLPVLLYGTRPLGQRIRGLAVVAALMGVSVLPVVEALVWLRAPLRLSHPGAHEAFRGGVGQLARDWWQHPFDTLTRHDGAGGSIVVLPLALWGVVAVSARPSGEKSTPSEQIALRCAIAAACFCAVTAYGLSSLVERATALQPYRFLIPLHFFACIPAGIGAARWGRSLAGRHVASWVFALAAVCLVANAAWGLSPMLVLGHGRDDAEVAVARFVERETGAEDRILVESSVVGLWVQGPVLRAIPNARFALLPTIVPREFLGYVGVEPFVAHRYARFEEGVLFGRHVAALSGADLEAIFARYAVSWVVGCQPATIDVFERFSSLVEDVAPAADCRIFRVRSPQRSRFLDGDGRVVADVDRIDVRDASGDRVVLKYHWVPTLHTVPELPIEEVREPGMPVGFIAVRPGGIRDFSIRPRSVLAIR